LRAHLTDASKTDSQRAAAGEGVGQSGSQPTPVRVLVQVGRRTDPAQFRRLMSLLADRRAAVTVDLLHNVSVNWVEHFAALGGLAFAECTKEAEADANRRLIALSHLVPAGPACNVWARSGRPRRVLRDALAQTRYDVVVLTPQRRRTSLWPRSRCHMLWMRH
jgi:hypothetical protein